MRISEPTAEGGSCSGFEGLDVGERVRVKLVARRRRARLHRLRKALTLSCGADWCLWRDRIRAHKSTHDGLPCLRTIGYEGPATLPLPKRGFEP